MTTIPPGTTRYLCPAQCGWYHDVPPPTAADAAGIPVPESATNISEAISYLAGEAVLRTAAATEAVLVAHLDTHTTLEFVTALERLHAEIRELTAPALAPPAPRRVEP
jgi:hypothetical protein